MKKAENKDIGGLIFELEPLVFKMESLSSLTSPIKIASYDEHEHPQGIDGWLVEGRVYYDAFVLNNKKGAIYVSKQPASK